MPNYFNPQQQPPGMFPKLDEMKNSVHPLTKYVLAAVGTIGGYMFGLSHDQLPLALFVGVGLVAGLLLVELIFHATGFLIGAFIVAVAALACWWLLNNEAALRQQRQTAPVQRTAPAPAVRSLVDILPGVQL